MNSFSVRCIFRWDSLPDRQAAHVYEERITLWRADNASAAIELADQEADRYSSESGAEFLNCLQAYELAEPFDAHGVEVFSLLRDSDLEPPAYIGTFFDTGFERQRPA
ncbi:hypothetical protein [Planctellipticum variicoloris]|uniref:hypothetical protein n=1 Tax=Planctellipticum variicoloris TaxID=3064265 RepID=UPI003013FF1E|nr:DUF4288 domain-containing protein [Planctomycetaceae bacterium SH412]